MRRRHVKCAYFSLALILLFLVLWGERAHALPIQNANSSQPQADATTLTNADYPLSDSLGHIIPIQYDPLEHPLPTIQISINGSQPYPFIVDTACDASMVIFDWAEQELKLPLNGKTIRVNPGNIEAHVLEKFDLNLPEQKGSPLHLSAFNALTMESNFFSDMYRPRVAGILGFQFFGYMTSLFDFDKHTLTLFIKPHPPLSFAPPAVILPMKVEPGGLLLNTSLSLPGLDPTPFTIDTGCFSSVVSLDKSHKLQGLNTADAVNFDLGGTRSAKDVLLEQLTLGTLKLPMVTMMTVEEATKEGTAKNLLGVDILRAFRVTFDPRHEQMILEPRKGYRLRRIGNYGLQEHVTDHKMLVVKIYDPMLKSHVQVNDRVLSVEGTAVEDVFEDKLSLFQFDRRSFGYEGQHTTVVLEKPGGKQETVSLFRTSAYPDIVPGLLGMTLLKEKNIAARVLEIEPGSAADQAGIKPDDEIVAVNDKPILNWTAQKMLLETLNSDGHTRALQNIQVKHKADGKTIALKVENEKLLSAN